MAAPVADLFGCVWWVMDRLGDLCRIDLGFKSLLNDFYYVTKDTVREFGIESEYLVPLYMLADLDSSRYVQTRGARRWLFSCHKEPPDIANTGAGRYVEWGAKQEVIPRKQANAAKGYTWANAPAVARQRRWYSHAWPARKAKIAIRKGVDVTYAPFLFAKPVLLDQRLYMVTPLPGIDERVLTAYLCSSFFPLALETDAELGLGAGVLTLGTHLLRSVPALPLKAISQDAECADRIREAADALHGIAPPGASRFTDCAELRALDEAFLSSVGLPRDRASELEAQVAALAVARTAKGRSRQSVSRATRETDIGAVARGVAERLRPWLGARQFPEGFMDGAGPVTNFNLPPSELRVRTERFMGECRVHIADASGSTILDQEMNLYVAELFVRCLQLGRRNFTMPAQQEMVAKLLSSLEPLAADLRHELEQAVQQTTAGARYAEAVRSEVLRQLGVDLDAVSEPFRDEEWKLPAVAA
jgi:hypothetical protein